SGGGQTKCLKYIPEGVRIIKDNLFEPPVIFDIIRKASKAPAREMYQVFNMGCRLEIYTTGEAAEAIIQTAARFGVDARIIGRVEPGAKKELIIHTSEGELRY
ncbi:MAG: phosphoribosylformylglycinamidine cyclo-ligase, partial [Chitinophagaceae bacterium]|nr:phosphoribosylformylglycinamidine cyclo-ligase [Chitinophagaceae bacterium]